MSLLASATSNVPRDFMKTGAGALGLSRLVTRRRRSVSARAIPSSGSNLRTGMPPVQPGSGVHICLRAKSAGDVDAFHGAALMAGGRSDGAQVCVRTIGYAITQRSCLIPMATALKR